ncbi:MAG: hypothetical protein H9897_02235 [Candidatus Ureaplasma intestinipullorum]|uniref:Replication-associated protein ORF2/G2P domain-containing protein n=2 Tax=Bacillati TaxID=1783272 RepID=A0A9D9E728_9LACO|nr:hypothetical protein [Candidatus Gallilactobacillus intestinavium]MBU3830950.1 hypothetical protein [Candidatus Ureaplasma intestinipullorum]
MIIKKNNKKIKPNDKITIYENNNKIQINYTQQQPKSFPIKKINNNYYENKNKKIKKITHSSKRNHKNSNYVSSAKLQTLIKFNFIGSPDNESFITLTYKYPNYDPSQLNKDFNKFIRKLKSKNKNLGFIRINELQQNKSFHIHLLLKNVPNLNKLKIQNLWPHGLINYKPIENQIGVNKLANYFKYSPNSDNKKKITKSKLLEELPTGINLYSKSKNIKFPTIKKAEYKDIQPIIENYNLLSVNAYQIIDSNGQIVNQINKEFYNKK